ncbi:MAG: ABC transporter ATP-binding protein [Rhodospirillaceae bacterium]|nr:ABC transporter ATP-binding protein [Rhodospirillaceae bacterium]MBT5911472.1 ABC transporter ATP-binding protein [Rhodospirillaceae bacterium]MBT6307859.1 ABC transporter ATP-binding protein [Rhodospirillaceae bacterium]MBT7731954.1 ABC transporter ATP-binding protein [Rhodospirillaceae bacterium]MDC1442471.1 ABC transporter ATP-binding protein/permease [Rhodospirillaceae bacterium]
MTSSRHSEKPPKAVVGSQVSHEEEMFGKAFDGIVIGRFLSYCLPYKKSLALAVVAVLIFTITQISIPLIILYIIDNALVAGSKNRSVLDIGSVIFGLIIIINYAANFFQENLVGRAAERVLIDLRRDMFSHLQQVSLSFMDKTEVGRLMSRLQSDVNSLQEFLETSVFAVGDLVLLVGIIIVLLMLDLNLALLTLCIVPTLFVVRFIWLPRARAAFIRARESNSITNGALAEAIHGVRTVQGMVREQTNFNLYTDRARENMLAHLRAAKFAQFNIPIVDTLTGTAMAIVIVFGGKEVMSSELELGVMVAFIFYVQRFFDPIRSLTLHYSFMQRAMVSGQRILEVLDVPISIKDKENSKNMTECDGSIEFRDVTFGYVSEQPILQNISFKVNPGETVALVGPTGSGKTSITALVHRFYDAWEGEVLIGGDNVRDVSQESLGEHVSMVLQEPFLFTGSILDNIKYRCSTATLEKVIDAARAVGADDFIRELPEGYETILEQRGANLSLGQRQLISFARAILADAKILVLDEATASVDSYTEMQIQMALKKLLEGRTGLVIAHRLATIRGCDRIIVLQDGKIFEEGNHDELMQKNGLYAHLYSLNYASFDDIPENL